MEMLAIKRIKDGWVQTFDGGFTSDLLRAYFIPSGECWEAESLLNKLNMSYDEWAKEKNLTIGSKDYMKHKTDYKIIKVAILELAD